MPYESGVAIADADEALWLNLPKDLRPSILLTFHSRLILMRGMLMPIRRGSAKVE